MGTPLPQNTEFRPPMGVTKESLRRAAGESACFLRDKGFAMSLLRIPEEIPLIYELENAAFEPAEIPDWETFKTRTEEAQGLSYVLKRVSDDRIVGFICATLSSRAVYTLETLYKHQPEGTNICIQSVVVAKEFQRQGLAMHLMRAFLGAVLDKGKQATLIARPPITNLYQKCGFSADGWSDIKLGDHPWMHMTLLY